MGSFVCLAFVIVSLELCIALVEYFSNTGFSLHPYFLVNSLSGREWGNRPSAFHTRLSFSDVRVPC